MVKRFIYILIGLSLILGCAIFVLYRNNNDEDEVVVDIIKDDNDKLEKKDTKVEEKVDKVTVDIKGMVNNPGVYEIDVGKRINDVIVLAGGLREEADTSNINLAKVVTDEMAIIIYSKEEVLEKYKKEVCVCDCSYITNDACINDTSDNTLVNINTASKEELMSLPGLGEAKAKEIIEYREKNGNFKLIDDLMNVSGIGEAVFAKIKDYITI